MDGKPPVKVIFILGFARSGTTILGNLLGEIDGFFHLGEIHRLWSRLPRRGLRCGCREDLQDCAFWAEVLSRAVARIHAEPAGGSPPASEYTRSRTSEEIIRHIPRELLDARSLRGLTPSEGYARTIETLLHSVVEVSGARVLVDSSKVPALAEYTRGLSTLDPYFLHVVRDPRGAVLSRQRRKALQAEGRFLLNPLTTSADAFRWMRVNLAAHAVCRTKAKGRHVFLSYERFIAHPAAALRRVVELVGEEPAELPLRDHRTAFVSMNHTVNGNRNRFQTGEVELRLDDRWVRSLRTRDHMLITLLTLPLLIRYGYPLQRPRKALSAESGDDRR